MKDTILYNIFVISINKHFIQVPVKKYKPTILTFLSSPLFISVCISLTIIIFLLPPINKYEAELKDKIIKTDRDVWFYDLDHDGYSERIYYHKDYINRTSVLISRGEKIVDQCNLTGKLISSGSPVFADFNHNSKTELFIFTYSNDSIFINWFEPLIDTVTIKRRFISRFTVQEKEGDIDIFSSGFFDNNQDGFDEYFFVIHSGFSFQPRSLFVYDINNDSLTVSPKSGQALLSSTLFDLNEDSIPEILMSTAAYGNDPEKNFPYSDFKCWLMAFSNNAKFFFKPVLMGEFPSILKTTPFTSGEETYIAALFLYTGIKNINCSLKLFSANGQLIKERSLGKICKKLKLASLHTVNIKGENKLFLIFSNGEIEEIDNNLYTINEYYVPDVYKGIYNKFSILLDIDNDGEQEWIFKGKDDMQLIISRNDFSHPVVIDLQGNRQHQGYTTILNGNQPPDFFVSGEEYAFIFDYHTNPLYYAKYPVYAVLFIVTYLISFLINQYRKKIKYEMAEKIAELQIKSIQKQTDSHFTFNIINAIGSLFEKKDSERANFLFTKYTKLLRAAVLSSDKIAVTLSQEMEDVENFLILEKFRMSDKFENIITDIEEINMGLSIPKTLIHTFVENAIKHGIRHLKKNGKIDISFNNEHKKLIIQIKDNGIGRNAAKEHAQFTTGKGLKILDQILQLYYSLKKVRISYKIKDLIDKQNHIEGTQVIITIPVS